MQGVIVNIVRILNYINHNEKILSYFLGVKKILVIVSTNKDSTHTEGVSK